MTLLFVTVFEWMNTVSNFPFSSIPIDYNLYRKFWTLQDYFRNPVQCYDKFSWMTFLKVIHLSTEAKHIFLPCPPFVSKNKVGCFTCEFIFLLCTVLRWNLGSVQELQVGRHAGLQEKARGAESVGRRTCLLCQVFNEREGEKTRFTPIDATFSFK